MEKKQIISWGVSFTSVALVAGMVSFLGITKGFSSNSQLSIQNQRPQNDLNSQQGFYQGSNNDNGSSFDQNDDSSFEGDGSPFNRDNGASNGDNGIFSDGGSFGHHNQFDTTTGGT